jgi:hypothetical protein
MNKAVLPFWWELRLSALKSELYEHIHFDFVYD